MPDTTTNATVCRCGHTYMAHDAGECWVVASGTGRQCGCSWQAPATPPAGSPPQPEPATAEGMGTTEPHTLSQGDKPECPACGRLHFPWCKPHDTADTAHDRAHAWMTAQLHQVWCGGTEPPRGDRLGQAVHANHDYDARDILDGCEVREEWGARRHGHDRWARQDGDAGRDVAQRWVAAADASAQLIRRYVITTPPTEDQP